MTHPSADRIPIGVSSCLLGEPVRHDGGHKRNDYILETLGRYFDLQPFCPEVAAGLGVPRPPVRLVQTAAGVRARGVHDPELDVTERLRDAAAARRGWHAGLCGYLLKKDSPSCGMAGVRRYAEGRDQPTGDGVGLYAERLMADFPLLPVEEEERLMDPGLRESFVRRVHVLWRWRQATAGGLSARVLTGFHARYKLILMSHDQDRARELGRLAAAGGDLAASAAAYIRCVMETLKKPATRGNHANVLQHIQGHLKRELDADDRAELVEVIEAYRLGRVPLIVPITLLRHHFRRAPDPFIANSWYLDPYPGELALTSF
ncbi:MAG: YbgA family protein [Pseudomonadota bacterium]